MTQQQKGNISIHAQNIMPIIKRWLYSDKDIFVREMVSNGCDAITKEKMLHPDQECDYRVTVTTSGYSSGGWQQVDPDDNPYKT